MINKNIGIIGLGLIGGSIVKNLKGRVNRIIAFDKNKKILNLAFEKKIIDEIVVDLNQFKKAHILIIALYPKDTIDFILKNKSIWNKKQLLMDVSGLKKNIVNLLQKKLPKEIEFLGTHPIAGREEKGFKMSKQNLFSGTIFIITPTKKNTKKKIKLAKNIIKLMGVKNIYEISPILHDKIISYTSHLPHILACVYINNYFDSSKKMLGGSFKDITRVAKINEILWSELLIKNKKNNINEINKIINKLERIKKILEEENNDKLIKFLKIAKKIKEKTLNEFKY